MCMLDEIRAKQDEIYAIARKHKAEKLWVFGSCARKDSRVRHMLDAMERIVEMCRDLNRAQLQPAVARGALAVKSARQANH